MNELIDILHSISYPGNPYSVITGRSSVRKFENSPLNAPELQFLGERVEEVNALCHGTVRTALAPCGLTGNDHTFRPSTYGIIQNPQAFMLMAFDPADPVANFMAGAAMETAVLKASVAGIGTCWFGGTFRQSTFKEAAKVIEDAGHRIVIAVACGIASGKQSLIEKIERRIVKSDSRLPFSTLFAAEPGQSFGSYKKPLSMMRLAPSSLNQQPWRAVMHGDTISFYCTKSTHKAMIDMGIALAHFQLCANHDGLQLDWEDKHPVTGDDVKGMHYVISCRSL